MPPLQQGRVIWAEVADPNGRTKLRPALVLTRTDEIQPGESMQVVAITSRLDRLLPPDHVLLPWAPRGHTRSGLNRPCAAVCSWLAEVAEADIQEIGGIVSGEPLLAIIQKVNALKDQPESG